MKVIPSMMKSALPMVMLAVLVCPARRAEAVNAPTFMTSREVVEAMRLAHTTQERVDLAVRAVTQGSEVLVTRALRTVIASHDRVAISRLVDAFLARLHTESHPQFGAIAVNFLGEARARKAVPLLVHLLTSDESQLRALVARRLGEIGDPIAVYPIARLLREPTPVPHGPSSFLSPVGPGLLDPAIEAARALSAIGKSWATRPLVLALDGADATRTRAIIAALEHITDRSLGPVSGDEELGRTSQAWRSWLAHQS